MLNTPPSTPGRRAVVKGVAWTTPALVIGAAAPMAAASPAANIGIIFDGGGGANGYLNSTYLDLGSSTTRATTLTSPLVVTVDVIGLNTNTTAERSFTAGSDYGTLTRAAYNSSTRTTTLTWTLPVGTVLPPVGTGTNVPDILFSFGDGLAGFQRITNKIVVRSVTGGTVVSPSSPPIDSSVVKDVNKGAASPDGIY